MFRHTPHVPSALVGSRLADLVPPRELRRLEELGTHVRIDAGHTIVHEDAIGRECMVVVDGSFSVHRRGQQVAELDAGDFVGEIALITDRRRNASVTALADSSVYAFNPREFATLLATCPTIAAHVHAVAGERSLAA